MTEQLLQDIARRARSDDAYFAALSAGEAIEPPPQVADALRSGVTEAVSVEHGAYSGCNKTSCGCGGSI
jgi:hypothetical protein